MAAFVCLYRDQAGRQCLTPCLLRPNDQCRESAPQPIGSVGRAAGVSAQACPRRIRIVRVAERGQLRPFTYRPGQANPHYHYRLALRYPTPAASAGPGAPPVHIGMIVQYLTDFTTLTPADFRSRNAAHPRLGCLSTLPQMDFYLSMGAAFCHPPNIIGEKGLLTCDPPALSPDRDTRKDDQRGGGLQDSDTKTFTKQFVPRPTAVV